MGFPINLRGKARRLNLDADALDWANTRVPAAGGTVSASTLAAASAFAVSAKAAGYWSKLNRINLFCGNQLAAALVPLKVGGGSATETNVNFVSGDYTEATGLTGNASNKYLNTGLIPNATLTLNDTHLSVYSRAPNAAAGGTWIGTGPATGLANCLSLYAPSASGNLSSEEYGAPNGELFVATSAPYGHIVATRTAANAHSIYKAGSAVASNATTNGALLATAIFVGATNNAGSPEGTITGPVAAYSIGSGLTAGDVTAYNTHMQAFQTALSRNV